MGRWWIKNIAALVTAALALFLSAGDFNWWQAWLYLAATLLIMIANNLFADQSLKVVRSKMQKGTPLWDVFLSVFVGLLGPILILVTSGLSRRFISAGFLNPAFNFAALLVFMTGGGLGAWAMAVNKYFSATVHLQHERNHQVVTAGPYKYVRHPGYSGAITGLIATPFALNSKEALLPAAFVITGIIIRTTFEDKFLKKELPGYQAYAAKVAYRLFPGIW